MQFVVEGKIQVTVEANNFDDAKRTVAGAVDAINAGIQKGVPGTGRITALVNLEDLVEPPPPPPPAA